MSSKDLDDIGMRNEEQEREDLDDDSMRDEDVNEDEDDEIETLTKMVTGCEAFVTSAVIGLTNEIEEKSKLNAERFEQCLKERDAKISELTKRLDQFEDVLSKKDEEINRLRDVVSKKAEEINPCRCKELFNQMVTAGTMFFQGSTLMLVGDSNNQSMNVSDTVLTETTTSVSELQSVSEPTSAESMVPDQDLITTSTPIPDFNVVSDSQPRVLVEPVNLLAAYSKSISCTQTAETLADLPGALRTDVEKFFKPKTPEMTNDLLTDLQRAYVKYFIEKPENRALSPSALAKTCISKGISDSIWTAKFSPPGVSDFYKYLHQRIRNIRSGNQARSGRSSRLRKLQKSQASRLEEMCNPKRAKMD